MSRVVVLGASGFLGTHVVNELVARDHDVLAVTLVPPPAEARPRVTWHQVDLDRSFDPSVFDAPVCVHLAEPAAIVAAAEGEASLARAGRVLAGRFTRIVYASSAVVYGDRVADPRREAEPATPIGTYAVAKLAVEALVAADPRCLAIRVGNAYGPGMSPRNVLSDILGQLHAAGPLAVRDLSPVRDYVHVTDIARAFVAAAFSTVVGVLNIATGRGTSVADLARIACAAAGTPDRPLVSTAPGSPSTLILDIERARRELAWAPAVSVEQGIEDLVQRP